MNLNDIQYCPSTLAPGYSTYSPKALNELFGSRSRKVSHVLSFPAPGKNDQQTKEYNEKRKGISISGYQEKYSLRLDKTHLDLVDSGGQYILKPIPAERLMMVDDLPANEHLTMQIASQAFGIETADSAMIFFEDGSPAYLTKRFDYKPDGTKYQIEDFATLMGLTPETDKEFKIKASYADIAMIIDRFVPAAKLEKMKFFKLVVFNYVFSNGDAHLKNFSLLESRDGDYLISPAYDLVCTSLHIDDGDLALQGGLYEKDYDSPAFQRYGIYTYDDFILFAEKIGIEQKLAANLLKSFRVAEQPTLDLIAHSFLSINAKTEYEKRYRERCNRLSIHLNQ